MNVAHARLFSMAGEIIWESKSAKVSSGWLTV